MRTRGLERGAWRGAVYEPYPESVDGCGLSDIDPDEFDDRCDELSATQALRLRAIVDDMARRETPDDEVPVDTRGRGYERLRGVTAAHSLIVHHGVRALEYGVPSTLTLEEWGRIRLSHRGQCPYCGKACLRPTIDHVVPISRGGANEAGNVAAVCRTCNVSKNARDLREWLLSKGFDVDVVMSRLADARSRQVES